MRRVGDVQPLNIVLRGKHFHLNPNSNQNQEPLYENGPSIETPLSKIKQDKIKIAIARATKIYIYIPTYTFKKAQMQQIHAVTLHNTPIPTKTCISPIHIKRLTKTYLSTAYAHTKSTGILQISKEQENDWQLADQKRKEMALMDYETPRPCGSLGNTRGVGWCKQQDTISHQLGRIDL
ncbi:hypothetical protein CHS0354_012900 [Potamilus streckersoni]|uniref:Uncharacterized protein n=1 Tax=Potamilus streckersoni TaxID=2493646 RepID=A0AAE0TAE0_9BIVA|nr:hypothetical protein CHS0354_012900 [Potamilus streckersoni]